MSKISIGRDDSVAVLQRILELNSARQKVAARNLANSATEGYRPRKVEFTGELEAAAGRVEIARTDSRHMAPSSPRAASAGITEIVDEEALADGETGLERTVADLADAEMAYATAARLMSRRVATIKTAISGKP